MMKLRQRRPLSVYNASPNSDDRTARKRQRKASSNPSISDQEEENESDLENHSNLLTSDGRILLNLTREKEDEFI